jgi:hypothetical protein
MESIFSEELLGSVSKLVVPTTPTELLASLLHFLDTLSGASLKKETSSDSKRKKAILARVKDGLDSLIKDSGDEHTKKMAKSCLANLQGAPK